MRNNFIQIQNNNQVNSPQPAVSVIICTRNRPDQIGRAVKSVLENTYPDFKLYVIDQSSDQSTNSSLEKYKSNSRFQYVASSTTGLSIARNLACSLSADPIIIFTDDDCEARFDWIAQIVAQFRSHPNIGAIFGTVEAAEEFNLQQGFLPNFYTPEDRIIWTTQELQKTGFIMGANMSFRREVLKVINGFDQRLGPGAPLRSSDDIDAAYRVLLAGYGISILKDAVVIHYGFREYKSKAGTKTLLDSMYSYGAFYAKYVRCGDRVALLAFMKMFRSFFTPIFSRLIEGQLPLGVRMPLFLVWGFINSWRFKVDRDERLYK